jgi:hypothetical protein
MAGCRAYVARMATTHTWGYHPARSLSGSADPRLRAMVAPLVEAGFTPLDL